MKLPKAHDPVFGGDWARVVSIEFSYEVMTVAQRDVLYREARPL